MRAVDCLSEQDLRAFLLGELPERVALAVSRHLENCLECEAVARRLDHDTDAVIRSLRRAVFPAAGAIPDGKPDVEAPEKARAIPDCPPRYIAGYEVLAELGRGGMSVVYQARQTHPERLVALK